MYLPYVRVLFGRLGEMQYQQLREITGISWQIRGPVPLEKDYFSKVVYMYSYSARGISHVFGGRSSEWYVLQPDDLCMYAALHVGEASHDVLNCS